MKISKASTRLLSLDVMRGITICGMILVNNPGSWSHIYAPLKHAEWNGLTPTDLVFPFFMFIMGISCYASLRKFNFEPTRPVITKILKRTVKIFLVGLLLNFFYTFASNYNHLEAENIPFFTRLYQSVTHLEHLRILGVLQRLALCYGAGSLIAVLVKSRNLLFVIAGGLLGYFLILLFGHGFVPDQTNIIGVIDRAILGENHMYIDMGIEPEGLLSAIPSVCHVLIGFCCGRIIMETKENKERMLSLFLLGTILFFIGFLLSYGCPVIKKVWSPTYVLVTCGAASLLLSLLIWLIDEQGYKSWSRFFEVFGVNPLAIYVFAGVFATLVEEFKIGGIIPKTVFYNFLSSHLDIYFSSFIYALIFICVCWGVGYYLYKKKIYIKL